MTPDALSEVEAVVATVVEDPGLKEATEKLVSGSLRANFGPATP